MPMSMCSRCKRLYLLGSRCEQCSLVGAKRREQKRKHTRPSRWARGYNTQYLKARAAILADNPLYFICNSQPASTADQIVPLSRGGTNDIENLRPACGPCNFSRGNRTP